MISFETLIESLDANAALHPGGDIEVRTPIDGALIGRVRTDEARAVEAKIDRAATAFQAWRSVPAPRRGELVRVFAIELRAQKEALAQLVTLECGKTLSEARGEVQEMIDICDFAVGLSRQLYGLTLPSERTDHALSEQWRPLGPIGVITAFNFPVAVWAWNAALAIVCGDSVVWKPSEKTPLCALATQALFERAAARFGDAPNGLCEVVLGGRSVGEQLADDARLPLISATGSCRMGRALGPRVAVRFGRSLLELGGNNAAIVTPTADLGLAARAICFSAAGTAGQRCTTLRRLLVHESVYEDLKGRLERAYAQLKIGDPFEPDVLVGPLIDGDAYAAMQAALASAPREGGRVYRGERVSVPGKEGGFYVAPALVEMPAQSDVVREETFAPILYLMRYSELEDAIAEQNDVPQGLSSCIFTTNLLEAEVFLSARGSDCGIANVNIGPSGAEIGGAFGGEKETGGGREAGSDAWKNYMRRQTQTVNYSSELPLAQGVKFDVE